MNRIRASPAEERCGDFVIARCDAARLLETIEKTLDVVVIAIAAKVARGGITAIGLGRDDRQDIPLRILVRI